MIIYFKFISLKILKYFFIITKFRSFYARYPRTHKTLKMATEKLNPDKFCEEIDKIGDCSAYTRGFGY